MSEFYGGKQLLSKSWRNESKTEICFELSDESLCVLPLEQALASGISSPDQVVEQDTQESQESQSETAPSVEEAAPVEVAQTINGNPINV